MKKKAYFLSFNMVNRLKETCPACGSDLYINGYCMGCGYPH